MKHIKLESIPIIAILFGLCFTKGFVFLEHRYHLLGIPVERLGFDIYTYATYGGVSFLVVFLVILAFAVAWLLTTTITGVVIDAYSKNNNEKATETLKTTSNKLALSASKNINTITATLLSIIFALMGYLIFLIVIKSSSTQAESDAEREVVECVEGTVTLKDSTSLDACIEAETDDTVYLIRRTGISNGKVTFETINQPKEAIARIIQPGAVTQSRK